MHRGCPAGTKLIYMFLCLSACVDTNYMHNQNIPYTLLPCHLTEFAQQGQMWWLVGGHLTSNSGWLLDTCSYYFPVVRTGPVYISMRAYNYGFIQMDCRLVTCMHFRLRERAVTWLQLPHCTHIRPYFLAKPNSPCLK